MRIKDTEQVQEVTKDLMIPVGNTDTDDARHITLEQIKEYSNVDVQQNIVTLSEQTQQGLEYLGNAVDQLQVNLSNTETWTFELEDGTIITKEIVVK